jgi:hypothetical protein
MKFSIYIDQLTLQHWQGQIDAIDCLIIGFIDDLDPKDPIIKKHMWRGHFQINRAWLLEEMPMLGIEAKALYKRLKKLRELGIIDKVNRQIEGEGIRTNAYFKLSKLFYSIRAKNRKKATEATKNDTIPVPHRDHGKENPRTPTVESPYPTEGTYESMKDSLTPAHGDAALDGSPERGGEGKKDIAAAKCKCGLPIPRTTAYGCMNCSRPFPDGMNGREYLDSLAGAATG